MLSTWHSNPDGVFATSHSPRPTNRQQHSRASRASDDASASVAHTLAACTRCRNRKSKCDVRLPRCGPCDKAGANCEYFDTVKNRVMPRSYVLRLQDRISQLESQLEDLLLAESHDPDPEDLVRDAAAIKFTESGGDPKYLGPSSGTTMTRIVMQLAKQITNSRSINDIVSAESARKVKESYAREETKPYSKVYPYLSNMPMAGLLNEELTENLLLPMFNIKVQSMYPIFHEPTLAQDVRSVLAGSEDPYQNFITRMIYAIGLQRMDTQFAGLGDSAYLAAMQYFEAVVKPMDLHTLQCFVLIGEYSLLTPTRTAVFYVIGMAVRLAQALGLTDESTIVYDENGEERDFLDIDLRRKAFWAITTMDYGLAHSLGRPSIMSTGRERENVNFFAPYDDKDITKTGVAAHALPSTRKWIAIHFYEMRLLQLEIRRKLYQKRRPTPQSDDDPWFTAMQNKLDQWMSANPGAEEGEVDGLSSGFNNTWFKGRYNTMIVFLYRPSPQIPRPTTRAALMCFEACQYNIHMQKEQIITHSVELTWIFCQSLFMAVNTILWCLSYQEVRARYTKERVKSDLDIALDGIRLASARWPGVESALQLYYVFIDACLQIYGTEGDMPVSANSPIVGGDCPELQHNSPDGRARSTSASTSPYPSSRTLSAHVSQLPLPDLPRRVTDLIASEGSSIVSSAAQSMDDTARQPAVGYDYIAALNLTMSPEALADPVGYSWQSDDNGHVPPSTMNGCFPIIDPLVQLSTDAGTSLDSVYHSQGQANFWTPSPQLDGLNMAQQEELMIKLVAHGPSEIQAMIDESNAFWASMEPKFQTR